MEIGFPLASFLDPMNCAHCKAFIHDALQNNRCIQELPKKWHEETYQENLTFLFENLLKLLDRFEFFPYSCLVHAFEANIRQIFDRPHITELEFQEWRKNFPKEYHMQFFLFLARNQEHFRFDTGYVIDHFVEKRIVRHKSQNRTFGRVCLWYIEMFLSLKKAVDEIHPGHVSREAAMRQPLERPL